VSDIAARNVHFTTAKHTELKGDFTIKGLPDINKTVFDFDLHKLQTTPQDVEVLVPKFANRTSFTLPQELHSFEQINFHGKFKGFYNDFHVDGNIGTALGSLTTKSQIAIRKTLTYTGT